MRGDLVVYESRLTPKILGFYSMAILLDEKPIRGSPVRFEVLAGTPDVKTSKLVLPEAPLFPQTEYDLLIVSVDKYGNECTAGGLHPRQAHGREPAARAGDQHTGARPRRRHLRLLWSRRRRTSRWL